MAEVKENWFSSEEYQARLAAVRAQMESRQLDGLLLFSPANVYYLVGHHSIDSWEFRALFITPDRDPVLLLFNFERGRFEASSWLQDARFYGATDDPVDELAALAEGLEGSGFRVTRTRAKEFVSEWQIGNADATGWLDLALQADSPEAEAVVVACSGIRQRHCGGVRKPAG